MKQSVPEPAWPWSVPAAWGPSSFLRGHRGKDPRAQPEHRMALSLVKIVKYWAWVQMGKSYYPEPSRHPLMYPMPTQPLPGNF